MLMIVILLMLLILKILQKKLDDATLSRRRFMQQTAGVVPEPNNLRQVHGDRLWNRRQADVPQQLRLTGVNRRLPRHLRQHNCCRIAPLSVYRVYAFNRCEQTHACF
jgi:hypothetical protein